MYIPFLPVTCIPRSKKFNSKSFFNIEPHKLLFFESGRQSIEVGLDAINLKKNDEVLMPASLCEAVIEPFFNKELKVSLYDLDKDMSFNVDEILSNISTNTKAIYVIHYFGLINKKKIIETKRGL